MGYATMKVYIDVRKCAHSLTLDINTTKSVQLNLFKNNQGPTQSKFWVSKNVKKDDSKKEVILW